eukprot:1182606-Prorocentrum_minimum.AAC.3
MHEPERDAHFPTARAYTDCLLVGPGLPTGLKRPETANGGPWNGNLVEAQVARVCQRIDQMVEQDSHIAIPDQHNPSRPLAVIDARCKLLGSLFGGGQSAVCCVPICVIS